ncbi:helix-turn-helix domain-containing protein [Geobacillus thermodenitrificans]|uniref:helix-turn-helix domain-containing protein n=1 Tax=Geobacillus thermodenitrificans TaxID=33940 RepID=UPI002E1A92BF|nr:helix-turn-helix domain-containing protein [Geobacillus thermodenitrificans]
MRIKDKGRTVIIWENLMEWHDKEKDSFLRTSPIQFENGEIVEINEQFAVIEKHDGFALWLETDNKENGKILMSDDIMSTKEAAEKWGINESAIRKRIDDFPIGSARKFGKQWVVTADGMRHVFGDPKDKG